MKICLLGYKFSDSAPLTYQKPCKEQKPHHLQHEMGYTEVLIFL